MEELDQIVSNLITQAQSKPFDMDGVVGVLGTIDPCPSAYIKIEGISCFVQLSYYYKTDSKLRWWHLSMSQKDKPEDPPKPLPENILDLLKYKFLEEKLTEGVVREFPSLMCPGIVRQYLKFL